MDEDDLNPPNPNPDESKPPVPPTPPTPPTPPETLDLSDPKVKEAFEAALDERLGKIKENLDKAYGQRDEALSKIKAFEDKERQAEIDRMEAEGKFKEAAELREKQLREENENLRQTNLKLTRDSNVTLAINSLEQEFRNGKALKSAIDEMTAELVQDKDGNWVHKSGVSISEYVKAYAQDAENAYLFKPKQSRGTGNPPDPKPPSDQKTGSLFDLPQDEVLARARKGELGNQRRF